MSEIKYEIVEQIAILSEKGNWTKELNVVRWNDNPEKYDIRDWNHSEGKIGKGVTLTELEMEGLKIVLDAMYEYASPGNEDRGK